MKKKCAFLTSPSHTNVVISGNGGYPLDQNLYQAVKSMAIGELGVKAGGTVISVNACCDGVGHEKFQEMLNSELTPKEMFDQIVTGEIKTPDQWEIQVLCRVLMKADVYVVSNLEPERLGTIGLKYAETVEDALASCREKYGDSMRVLVTSRWSSNAAPIETLIFFLS